jgi:hypothetical protein
MSNRQPDSNYAANAPRMEDAQTYTGPDRRQNVVDARTEGTGLERRRGPGKRRSAFAKSAEEGEMTPEQFNFIMAIDAYKRVNQKPFPTWTEVLEVIRKLGYRKTAPTMLALENTEDWFEAPTSDAFAKREEAEPDADEE